MKNKKRFWQFKSKNKSKKIYPFNSDAPTLHRLLELIKHVFAETEVSGVLDVAMDQLIELSGAERGMIILFDKYGEIIFDTVRNLEKKDIEQPQFEISHTVINIVRQSGDPIWKHNALEDPMLNKSKSITRLKVLSIICLPLHHNNKIFGVVYLDNRTLRGVFEVETFALVREFANFISLASYQALDRKQLYHRVHILEKELRDKYRFESIISHHPKMMEILKLVSQVAKTNATVLIQGESGTGKELIARALHNNGDRKDKPFTPINCAAIPEHLLESELFGYVKGAFTNAHKDRTGWFECSDGGTIFLDEVNDMSLILQAKLLRILQTGEYSRLGSTEIRHCDVRIIAATNKDLQKLVRQGKFREDVYYRLNIIDIKLPPLRKRRGDIPMLIQHFLNKYNKECHKNIKRISPEAEALIQSYNFPGNVRDLENAIQRAVSLAEQDIIEPHHLPERIATRENLLSYHGKKLTLAEIKKRAALKAEKKVILECLSATQGHISKAAKMVGMDVSNFFRTMKKHSIDPNAFKKLAKPLSR